MWDEIFSKPAASDRGFDGKCGTMSSDPVNATRFHNISSVLSSWRDRTYPLRSIRKLSERNVQGRRAGECGSRYRLVHTFRRDPPANCPLPKLFDYGSSRVSDGRVTFSVCMQEQDKVDLP